MPYADPDEPDLTAALEGTPIAPAMRLVDMDTGEIHTGTALATAAPDGEWISREARLQTLESMAVEARDRYIRANLEMGAILREHHDLCLSRQAADGRSADNRFDLLVERLGFGVRQAYRLITVASGVAAMPALRTLAEGQWTKALALIEGSSDEQIAQIAAGQGDLTLDEIDGLSVRQLKTRLRKSELEVGKIVAAETKKLRSDLEAVTEDLTLARSALDADVAATRKTVDAVRALVTELSKLSDRFSDQVANISPQEGDRLLVRFESEFGAASTILESTWRRWQDRRLELGLTD
jgi:hypothetical protein